MPVVNFDSMLPGGKILWSARRALTSSSRGAQVGRDWTFHMHAMEKINRETWSAPLSLRGYRRISGYIDGGERRAFELAVARFRGGRFLDIGVGGGRTAALLAPHAGCYLGVDYTPEMVELARSNHPDLDFQLMDARKLRVLENGSQDLVVFSHNGIDSVDPAGRLSVLREVYRVLAPGGAFVFSTFHRHWSGFKQAPAPRQVMPPTANPILRGLRYYRYIVGALKARQRRQLEVRQGEHAILLHHAHYFGIMVYATTPAQIEGQLLGASFAPRPLIFDENGAEVGGHGASETEYFHIVAAKPSWA
jgi:SAM-dependent methyltransferase